MNPLVITAALVGGELTKEDTPFVPISPKEIAIEAIACRKVGASIVHLHARDKDGSPKHDEKIFKAIIVEINKLAKEANIDPPIIQFSTGGSIGMGVKERIAPLKLKPEMATLTTGSVNFGPDIFANDQNTMESIAKECLNLKIAIEIEVFDAGMIDNVRELEKKGLLTKPLHFNFVLGVPGGLLGDPENLIFLRNKLYPNETWSVAGIGRYQLPLATMAIILGGHVRVGLEDNIYFRKGELAKGNAPLVERVRKLAESLNRDIADPKQTRKCLSL